LQILQFAVLWFLAKNFFTKANEQQVCCDEGTNFQHPSGCFVTNLRVDTAEYRHRNADSVLSLLHEHMPLALHTQTHLHDHLGHSSAGLPCSTAIPYHISLPMTSLVTLSTHIPQHVVSHFCPFAALWINVKTKVKLSLYTHLKVYGGRKRYNSILNLSTR
jgi:hypothetical protein